MSKLTRLLGLACAAVGAAHAQQFSLHMLPGAAGAACLDGSPYGFYWQQGAGMDAYNWMFYFQGGGWCYDAGDCYGRAHTNLGSSTKWAATSSLSGLLSANCSTSPFCNWNKVFMVYCDGNSFTGAWQCVAVRARTRAHGMWSMRAQACATSRWSSTT